MRFKSLWIAFTAVIVVSFAVLGYYGWEIYRKAPPIPASVVTPNGDVLMTAQEIKDGQNIWQSMGGHQVGSIWGHGAYVAPDWSADWLHREAVIVADGVAQENFGKPMAELDGPEKAAALNILQTDLRTNTYDAETDTLTVSPRRAAAMAQVADHYTKLFGGDPAYEKLRHHYALPEAAIKTPERLKMMNDFFFWAAWACVTERPGSKISYTNNWPHDELVGNTPSSALLAWSILSFVVLLAGIGALAWHHAMVKSRETEHQVVPQLDPLLNLTPTPSMRATIKYFWTVVAMMLFQILMGVITAHYGVEGSGFYGIPIQEWIPYSLTRTWHTQLGIFWIATAWLATGLFVAPAVSGYEPPGQKFFVNFLYVCVLIIVVGAMIGQWFGVMQKLGYTVNFYFGHQGYEYVELGRFFQWFLFVGLFIWLGLLLRALWPALKRPDEGRHLLFLFVISSAAIAIFWGAGLMWDRQTNLAMAEYWRWWVVHLWVEGFFEVFATVVIAFLFTRLGLLNPHSATAAVLFSCTIFLFGGILGTFHHLYFTGTPTAIIALGATFSALEIVPLALIGFEAYENLTLSSKTTWIAAYKWPIYFFVAVAFWNLVGAGIFGFLINPPIALYYIQGLNTTPLHSHTALFGVYGMLGMGLMLFCLRALNVKARWNEKPIKIAFWSLNWGLMLMAVMSLLPVGLMQAWASLNHGLWFARSADFMQTPIMQILRWARVPGDTIFAFGAFALGYFVIGLKFGWSMKHDNEPLIDPDGGIDENTEV